MDAARLKEMETTAKLVDRAVFLGYKEARNDLEIAEINLRAFLREHVSVGHAIYWADRGIAALESMKRILAQVQEQHGFEEAEAMIREMEADLPA